LEKDSPLSYSGFLSTGAEGPPRARPQAYEFYATQPSDAPMLWWAEMQKKVEALMRQREDARKRRDWTEADRLREELKNLGVTIEDTPSETRWTYHPRQT